MSETQHMDTGAPRPDHDTDAAEALPISRQSLERKMVLSTILCARTPPSYFGFESLLARARENLQIDSSGIIVLEEMKAGPKLILA